VRSTKPEPDVCTVRIDETIVPALTAEGGVRDAAIG
jgi:hypothetical protein